MSNNGQGFIKTLTREELLRAREEREEPTKRAVPGSSARPNHGKD